VRAVLDANVFLAGVFTRGVCERMLDICWDRAPAIVVVCSEHILGEFVENAVTKFGVSAEEITEVADKLRHRVEFIEPSQVPIDACRDRDDLPVLGTAMAGKADYLVTGDGDLLMLKSFHGIPILSPREFYDLVRESG
jgi:putative PIN family toxin of toxin-antitoxin system